LGIIRKRKMELSENIGSSHEDLLTRMLLIRDENGRGMEEREIALRIIGFFIASYDTVSSAITVVLNYLAELPQVYAEVLRGKFALSSLILKVLANKTIIIVII
jgi:cytochrome P450